MTLRNSTAHSCLPLPRGGEGRGEGPSVRVAEGERTLVAIVTLSSTIALACSGEGASEAMARANLVGLACLLVSFGATIGSVLRGRQLKLKAAPIAAALLLLAHPTVWLGVTSGDCGYTLLYAGPITAGLHAGILGFLLIKKPSEA